MKKVPLSKFIVVCTFLLLLALFCVVYPELPDFQSNSLELYIWIVSAFGWVLFAVSLLTWKRLTGSLFSLYSIFLVFAYLFTFGQCLMWAVGIHLPGEIGTALLYTLPVPPAIEILKTQLVTLIGLSAFHTGAVLTYQKDRPAGQSTAAEESKIKRQRKMLFQICVVTSIISTPLMFSSIIRNIFINRVYGYGAALYNAEVTATQNNLILLLRLMYIPSIIGLLITSRYRKKVVVICYVNFAVFFLLGLFAGDRGEWLFPLCLLVWMHHKYHKRINAGKLIRYALLAIVLTILSVAVRNSRSMGITVAGIREAISGESNPIVSAIFELGGSMRPALIVIRYGWHTYPYGNSYLFALLGMITERVIMLFIPGYASLSNWFSRVFLGIRYGAGFSFVAEAIMNYGPFGSVPALLIEGIVFSKIIFSTENTDYTAFPLKTFFGISTAYAMLQTIRNTLLVATKMWFFSTILILAAYYLYSSLAGKSGKT